MAIVRNRKFIAVGPTLNFRITLISGCEGCYENGTIGGTRCNKDDGFCSCRDGWFGFKCLFGESYIEMNSILRFLDKLHSIWFCKKHSLRNTK